MNMNSQFFMFQSSMFQFQIAVAIVAARLQQKMQPLVALAITTTTTTAKTQAIHFGKTIREINWTLVFTRVMTVGLLFLLGFALSLQKAQQVFLYLTDLVVQSGYATDLLDQTEEEQEEFCPKQDMDLYTAGYREPERLVRIDAILLKADPNWFLNKAGQPLTGSALMGRRTKLIKECLRYGR